MRDYCKVDWGTVNVLQKATKCSPFTLSHNDDFWSTLTKYQRKSLILEALVMHFGLGCNIVLQIIHWSWLVKIRKSDLLIPTRKKWTAMGIHPLMTMKQDQSSSLGVKWVKDLTSLHWLGLYQAASAHRHTTTTIVTGRTRRWKRKTVPEVCTLACLTFFLAEVWAGCWGTVTQQADVCGTGRELKSSFCGDRQWGIVG